MREILFRGKCNEVGKYSGQWIEGFYGEDDGKPIIARSKEIQKTYIIEAEVSE